MATILHYTPCATTFGAAHACLCRYTQLKCFNNHPHQLFMPARHRPIAAATQGAHRMLPTPPPPNLSACFVTRVGAAGDRLNEPVSHPATLPLDWPAPPFSRQLLHCSSLPPQPPFLVLVDCAASFALCEQVFASSSWCNSTLNFSTPSTTPLYRRPHNFAAFDYSTVSTPNNDGEPFRRAVGALERLEVAR